MICLFKDLIYYLRYPRLVRLQIAVGNSFALLLRLAVISICLGIVSGVLSKGLVSFDLVPAPGPVLIDHEKLPYLQFMLGAVLLAPLLEELIFRGPLRRFSGMIFMISFFAGVAISAITGTYWAFLISPPIFGVLFIIYRFTLAGSVSRKFNFWIRVFPFQFYLTAICFALVHLSNFEKGLSLLPFGLFYTLPQLCIGLVLGFTRMNYGLKYSIMLHSVYNLTFATLLFSRY